MPTFADIKNSSVVNVASMAPTGAAFKQLVNDCVRRMMRRGDWLGSIVPIYVCVNPNIGCVVWPRYVDQVRKMNKCNVRIAVSNMWYQFLPMEQCNSSCWSSWAAPGKLRASIETRTCVFSDILGDGRPIRAYSSTPLDNNKTIRIFGEQDNGQPLTTIGVGGWTDGITLVLNSANPPQSTVNVRRIDRVAKDPTQGPVRLFALNPDLTTLEDVAYYEASETNPNYTKTQISGLCNSGGCCGTTTGSSPTAPNPQSIIALVKLRHLPIVHDDDWVIVNQDTLKLLVLAFKAEEAMDREAARGYESDAVRESNLELSNAFPEDVLPIDLGETGRGDTAMNYQKCF